MNRVKFFDRVRVVFGATDLSLIMHAYWLARAVHRGQVRDEGGRYFEHCRRVAMILIDLPLPNPNEVTVALLHDCAEDGFLPKYLLEKLFNREVADAVSLLSKVTPIFDEQTGVIREKVKKDKAKYFSAIARSAVWVRRVKLADRLDNIRTMGVWPASRILAYLRETDEHLLPLAAETDRELAAKLFGATLPYRPRH